MNDPASPERGLFSNRTLNLRGVRAIGYDMDYTLIHYHVDEWERAAFEHARLRLRDRGWPVDDLEFDPDAFTLGLTFDLELGNLVKATRFGYVVRVQHGNDVLSFDEQRRAYDGEIVELGEDRFEFMNTLFELSRASLWTQLVAKQDEKPLPGVHSYRALYREIDTALGRAHVEGALKQQIVDDPERFVDLDPELVGTLRDQRLAGKQLLLITNSEWWYTQQMMSWCFDSAMPEGETWRDLFDLVIVSAAKPRFFAERGPIYRLVDPDTGHLEPHFGPLQPGEVYHGCNAHMVEEALGHDPSQFLYVGDHLFGDVHVTKDLLRWRTALIARELEAEVRAANDFAADEALLGRMMRTKTDLEQRHAQLRMERRHQVVDGVDHADVDARIEATAAEINVIDDEIAPLARAATLQGNASWGPLMRAGVDKSLFARQVEKYADVYTSRVSNFGRATPYGYLRAARGSLPHDDASAI
ncbi:MAG: HAD-IG family 5'-nucleotidase [Actinomycetota bacterium]